MARPKVSKEPGAGLSEDKQGCPGCGSVCGIPNCTICEGVKEMQKDSGQTTEELIPQAAGDATNSYSLLEPRMKKIYGMFYKELYYTPERRILDPKVQELISIAASLVAAQR